MVYKADSVYLDLLELAQREHSILDIHGAVTFNRCEDMTALQPVTFSTEESFIELPLWRPSADGPRTMQFQFTTNEQDAVLLYSLGVGESADFFGIEIFEGRFTEVFPSESCGELI